MNFLYSLIVVSAIYVFIKEPISAEEVSLLKDHSEAALAVIRKRNSILQLGIPFKYDNEYAFYNYDGTQDKDGSKEKFLFACPASDCYWNKGNEEYYSKYENKLPKDSTMFLSYNYILPYIHCDHEVKPSVEKSNEMDSTGNVEYCVQNGGEIYNVGYPILEPKPADEKHHAKEEWEIQFMSIYKICHSTTKDKGTLYTIHTIESPSLLLQQLWTLYTFDPTAESFKSSLDRSDKENNELFKEHYAYQFVGFDDMPTKPWGYTTLFHFNYVAIPKNEDLLTGMIAADNYIRLFSKENKKRLTFYSGSHQAINEMPIPCSSIFGCHSKPKQINLFWRIIMDDENNAVIMITQYTLTNCYQNLLCDENQLVVQKYNNGGCTYTCSVTSAVINQLGMYQLKIEGLLSLKLTQKIPTNATSNGVKPPDFTIYDIKEREKFMDVVKKDDEKVQSMTSIRQFLSQKNVSMVVIVVKMGGQVVLAEVRVDMKEMMAQVGQQHRQKQLGGDGCRGGGSE